MSAVTGSCGNVWNSSHVHRAVRPPGPRSVKSHASSETRGVGPPRVRGSLRSRTGREAAVRRRRRTLGGPETRGRIAMSSWAPTFLSSPQWLVIRRWCCSSWALQHRGGDRSGGLPRAPTVECCSARRRPRQSLIFQAFTTEVRRRTARSPCTRRTSPASSRRARPFASRAQCAPPRRAAAPAPGHSPTHMWCRRRPAPGTEW